MPANPQRGLRWLVLGAAGLLLLLVAATAVFWGDIVESRLDPKTPFQTYRPPPAPDYRRSSAWALAPAAPAATGSGQPAADVFFLGPTTYDGGHEWNAPYDHLPAERLFEQVMAPNYAGPFLRVGRIVAPRYRQAGLYSQITLSDDARDARRLPYGDVAAAFRRYLADFNQGRPLLIVGVEQGGLLAARLLAEDVARDPLLRSRLVAAYLIDTVVPADRPPLPPCLRRGQTGCVAAWIQVYEGQDEKARVTLARALAWSPDGALENLAARPALCFNPILGAVTDARAPARLHLGGADATGLDWSDRPAFLGRQTSAQCRGGVLRVTRPRSASLRRHGAWIERRRAPGFNLFYADLEADALTRLAAWNAGGRR